MSEDDAIAMRLDSVEGVDDEMDLCDLPSYEESVQNRNQYPELCKAIDRCKISIRDAFTITNAVLKDMKLLSPKRLMIQLSNVDRKTSEENKKCKSKQRGTNN